MIKPSAAAKKGGSLAISFFYCLPNVHIYIFPPAVLVFVEKHG